MKIVQKMKVSTHFFYSLILAAILYLIFNWKAVFILIGGVLIDIDHYLWYIFKYNKFNFFDCYNYYLERMDKEKIMENIGVLLVFHTVEFLLLIIFFSFYNNLALIFTIGVISHYLLDLIFLYTIPKRIIANHSIIWWILKNKIQRFK